MSRPCAPAPALLLLALLAGACLAPTAAQLPCVNGSTFSLNGTAPCTACSVCAAGTRTLANCTATRNTTCTACSLGTNFSATSNSSTCTACSAASSCAAGSFVSANCSLTANLACTTCPANTFTTAPGTMGSCTACSAASSCAAGTVVSSNCTLTANLACTSCPANTYTTAPGSTGSCTACPTGVAYNATGALAGQSSCKCAANYAWNTTSQTCAIAACVPGSTWSASGFATNSSVACTACTAPTTCTAGSAITSNCSATSDMVCGVCASGTFSGTAGSLGCTSCPNTTAYNISALVGQTACGCAPNFSWNTTSMTCAPVPCVAGSTYSAAGSGFAPCNACLTAAACAAGSYVASACSVTANLVCSSCTLGSTYSTTAGQSSCATCAVCAAGSFTNTSCTGTANTACAACPALTFSNSQIAAGSNCTACPSTAAYNSNSTLTGQSSCACSVGYLWNATSSTCAPAAPCVAPTFSATGFAAPNCTMCSSVCAAGSFVSANCSTTSDLACTSCPVNTYTAAPGLMGNCTACPTSAGYNATGALAGQSSCKCATNYAWNATSQTCSLVACVPGSTWSASGFATSSTVGCATCAAPASCPAGSAITANCTATSNIVCSACVALSTYSKSAANFNGCSNCTVCSPGTYVANFPPGSCTVSANTVCSACGVNTWWLGGNTGTNACTACSAASTCPAGSHVASTCTFGANLACASCAANTFSTSAGQSNCTACPVGANYTVGTLLGQTSCACALGFGWNAISQTCVMVPACVAGATYSATGYANPVCSPCSTTCAAPGSFISGACTPVSNLVCSPCAANTYSVSLNTTTCSVCGAGGNASYYATGTLTGQSSCACTVGQAWNASALACVPAVACVPGVTYSSSGYAMPTCSNCSLCPAGSFASAQCTVTSQTVCSSCVSGTSYSTAANNASACSTCTVCSPGTKLQAACSTTSNAACTSCNANQYTTSSNSNFCSNCGASAGFNVTGTPAGSSSCSCNPGYYWYNAGAGGWTCGACATTACAAGTYISSLCSQSTNFLCSPCAANTYSMGLNNTACMPCSNGTAFGVGTATGQSSCTCALNYVWNTTVAGGPTCTLSNTCIVGSSYSATGYAPCSACASCTAGRYLNQTCTPTSNGVCVACSAGTFTTAATAPAAPSCAPWSTCPPGSFLKTAGSSFSDVTCQTCASGTYSTTVNATSCTACPVSTFSAVAGAVSNTTCLACPLNSTAAASSSTCTCLPNFYSSGTPVFSCLCPTSYIYNASTMTCSAALAALEVGDGTLMGVPYNNPAATLTTQVELFSVNSALGAVVSLTGVPVLLPQSTSPSPPLRLVLPNDAADLGGSFGAGQPYSGALTLSSDGQYIVMAGYDDSDGDVIFAASNPVGSMPAAPPSAASGGVSRTIGYIDYNGNVNVATSVAGALLAAVDVTSAHYSAAAGASGGFYVAGGWLTGTNATVTATGSGGVVFVPMTGGIGGLAGAAVTVYALTVSGAIPPTAYQKVVFATTYGNALFMLRTSTAAGDNTVGLYAASPVLPTTGIALFTQLTPASATYQNGRSFAFASSSAVYITDAVAGLLLYSCSSLKTANKCVLMLATQVPGGSALGVAVLSVGGAGMVAVSTEAGGVWLWPQANTGPFVSTNGTCCAVPTAGACCWSNSNTPTAPSLGPNYGVRGLALVPAQPTCAPGYAFSSGLQCVACGVGLYSSTGVGACLACPLGTTTAAPASSDLAYCSVCAAGFSGAFVPPVVGSGVVANCTACTAGSFAASANYSVCTQCSAVDSNSYAVAAAALTCTCNANFFTNGLTGNGLKCSACPQGSTSTGLTASCTCGTGFSSNFQTGAALVCTCPAGSGLSGTGSAATCAPNVVGVSYTTAANSAALACDTCQAPTQYVVSTCSAVADTVCGSCTVGASTAVTSGASVTTNSACTCGANFISSGATPATQRCTCPAGFVTSGNSSVCTPCAANLYSTVANSSAACLACPSTGSVPAVSNPGSTVCSCPAGAYNAGTVSAPTCFACTLPNSYSNFNSSVCSCNAGYYGTLLAGPTLAACTMCQNNSYSNGGVTMCYCNAGFYSNNPVLPSTPNCAVCPAGSSSAGNPTSTTTCTCNAGFYWNGLAGSSLTCTACQTGSTSIGGTTCACGVNWVGNGKTGAQLTCTCPAGYTASGSTCSLALATNPFGTGNLLVITVGSSSTNLTNATAATGLLEIATAAVAGFATLQSIPLAVSVSGTDSTLGALTRSANGAFVVFAGVSAGTNTAPGPSVPYFSSSVPRVLARIAGSSTIDSSTSMPTSAYNGIIRAACSVDGSGYWLIGNSSTATSQGLAYVAHGSIAGPASSLFSTATNFTACAGITVGPALFFAEANAVSGVSLLSSAPTSAGALSLATVSASVGAASNKAAYTSQVIASKSGAAIFVADRRGFVWKSANAGAAFTQFVNTSAMPQFTQATYNVSGNVSTLVSLTTTSATVLGVALSADESTLYFTTPAALFSAAASCNTTCNVSGPLAVAPAGAEFRGVALAPCVANTYGPYCAACPSNSISSAGAATCGCSPGFYASGNGTGTTLLCVPCPGQSTSTAGLTTCFCNANFFHNGNGTGAALSCLACPSDASSPANSSSCSCTSASWAWQDATGQNTCVVTPTPTVSVTPSPTPSVSNTSSASSSWSPSPTSSRTGTDSNSPTPSPSQTCTPSITPSNSATSSGSPSITPSNTATPSVTPSASPTTPVFLTFSIIIAPVAPATTLTVAQFTLVNITAFELSVAMATANVLQISPSNVLITGLSDVATGKLYSATGTALRRQLQASALPGSLGVAVAVQANLGYATTAAIIAADTVNVATPTFYTAIIAAASTATGMTTNRFSATVPPASIVAVNAAPAPAAAAPSSAGAAAGGAIGGVVVLAIIGYYFYNQRAQHHAKAQALRDKKEADSLETDTVNPIMSARMIEELKQQRLAAARIDDGPTYDYDELEKDDLAFICEERGIDSSGKTKVLRKRLKDDDRAKAGVGDEDGKAAFGPTGVDGVERTPEETEAARAAAEAAADARADAKAEAKAKAKAEAEAKAEADGTAPPKKPMPPPPPPQANNPAIAAKRREAARNEDGSYEYDELEKDDLAFLCIERGLSTEGKAKDMRKRLAADDKANGRGGAADDEEARKKAELVEMRAAALARLGKSSAAPAFATAANTVRRDSKIQKAIDDLKNASANKTKKADPRARVYGASAASDEA